MMPAQPETPRPRRRGKTSTAPLPYAELHCLSNFSFLRGASHPEELVQRAAELGYTALAITDRNSLAGVVRAHVAAKEHNLHLIIGAEITPVDAPPIVLLAPTRLAYARLARLITRGRVRSRKGECEIRLADIAELCPDAGLIAIVVPEDRDLGIEGLRDLGARQPHGSIGRSSGDVADSGPSLRPSVPSSLRPSLNPSIPQSLNPFLPYRPIFPNTLYLAAELAYDLPDDVRLGQLAALSAHTGIPLIAANHVHYHTPERRYLQDVLTCIREKCTIVTAGSRLFANAERHLRSRDEIARRYAPYLELLQRTVEIAQRCTLSLDELRYEYPHELVPEGSSAMEYLTRLVWAGGRANDMLATKPRSHEATKETPMDIKTFRDLIAWQKAMSLAKQVYQLTMGMPASEKFGLTSQMRRAAVSVPSNIAEGHGRQSLTEYIRFLKVARGSLMELQTQRILAEELNFVHAPDGFDEPSGRDRPCTSGSDPQFGKTSRSRPLRGFVAPWLRGLTASHRTYGVNSKPNSRSSPSSSTSTIS